MDIDIDDDREENKKIDFILVDSLKEGVLDTSLQMGSFLEAFENSFKNGDAKRYCQEVALLTANMVRSVMCDMSQDTLTDTIKLLRMRVPNNSTQMVLRLSSSSFIMEISSCS